jgi:hypothetical protein
MIKLMRLLAATLMACLMGLAFAPARAATLPAGPALAVEAGSRATDTVQYYHHRRVYRAPRYTRPYYRRHVRYHRPVYRHRYYGRPVYYSRPVYRRCVTRPRTVWTPYGYERRWVRICR